MTHTAQLVPTQNTIKKLSVPLEYKIAQKLLKNLLSKLEALYKNMLTQGASDIFDLLLSFL